VEWIECGLSHVMLITSSSILYSMGDGSNGWLGHGDTSSSDQPKIVSSLLEYRIHQLVCTDHTTSTLCIPRKSPMVIKYIDMEIGTNLSN